MTFEKKLQIFRENLREINIREDLTKRQKALTALEIAKECCDANAEADEIRKLLGELNESLSPKEELLFLSEILCSKKGANLKGLLFIGSTDPTPAGAHSKISYVKNRYNDEAFEHFSHSTPNVKPDYASSFKEAAENVFDGRCEFCILPIMNSEEGRLMSFYSLLDRYELKICETVDLDADDSSRTIRYARVGKACKEQKERFQSNQSYIFEFSITAASSDFLVPLFEAAKQSKATLVSIDSLPVEYTTDTQRFFFSFSIPQKSSAAFRLFVALKHQGYMPIGLYGENK